MSKSYKTDCFLSVNSRGRHNENGTGIFGFVCLFLVTSVVEPGLDSGSKIIPFWGFAPQGQY